MRGKEAQIHVFNKKNYWFFYEIEFKKIFINLKEIIDGRLIFIDIFFFAKMFEKVTDTHPFLEGLFLLLQKAHSNLFYYSTHITKSYHL